MTPFSALDLLSMSDTEQRILRCLNQRPQLTLLEISAATQLPIQDVEVTLEHMLREARLVDQLRDGQRVFSVHFSREPSRPARNLSDNFLSLFERPDDTRSGS